MILVIPLPIRLENSKFSLKRSNDNLVIFIFIIVYVGNANRIVIELLVIPDCSAPPLLGLKY